MKKLTTLAITLFLLMSLNSLAQINWLNNKKLATAIATEKDQLILMDFWATWCGPCRKMDKEMWNTPEFKELATNFVALKVDIDVEKELATKYNIRSIPRVVLVTSSGDIVWEKTGYSHAELYQSELKNLPTSLNGINKKLLELSTEYQTKEFFSIAESYFELAMQNEEEFKQGFFSLSDQYYKEITKNSNNQTDVALAEMKMLLNDAYSGRYKRALRKVDKIEIGQNENLAEIKHFIQAYCFKCDGDTESYEKAKAFIKSEEYLSQLDQ